MDEDGGKREPRKASDEVTDGQMEDRSEVKSKSYSTAHWLLHYTSFLSCSPASNRTGLKALNCSLYKV